MFNSALGSLHSSDSFHGPRVQREVAAPHGDAVLEASSLWQDWQANVSSCGDK